jgi:DNA end-binding protein Ku
MPRSIWNGAISFGLVNVPVQLFSAAESQDVHFHQFTKSGQRVRNKRVAEKSGREVEYGDIVKGYELSKGKFVMIEPEELEAADPKQTRTIDLEDFVALEEIDPIYFEYPYYLAPQRGADKPYALLREALARTDRVGIGRFVMRTKQYLAAIRPSDKVLVLHTMYFADEVRDAKQLDLPARTQSSDRELRMAEQLIDSLTVGWDPKRYEDTYRAAVLDVIRRKSKGQEIVAETPEEPTADVVDLFAALQASLAGGKGRGRARRGGTRGTSRARKPAKSTRRTTAKRTPAKRSRKAS